MVEFIDNKNVEVVCRPVVKTPAERLDLREHVVSSSGGFTAYKKLAEVRRLQYSPIRRHSLAQYFFTVCNEQQTWPTGARHVAIVKSSDNSLSGTGRSHNEVTVAVVNDAFGVEILKNS